MRGRTSPVFQSSKGCSLRWAGHCKDVTVEKLTISFRYVSKVFQSPRGLTSTALDLSNFILFNPIALNIA